MNAVAAGQSRLESAVESVCNVAIGYSIGLVSQLVVFPLVGVQASFSQNLVISAFFTAISLGRSYLLRRLFNRRVRRA